MFFFSDLFSTRKPIVLVKENLYMKELCLRLFTLRSFFLACTKSGLTQCAFFFQHKSGKELEAFLCNDFLLLTRENSSLAKKIGKDSEKQYVLYQPVCTMIPRILSAFILIIMIIIVVIIIMNIIIIYHHYNDHYYHRYHYYHHYYYHHYRDHHHDYHHRDSLTSNNT